jgi:hypothetical protein
MGTTSQTTWASQLREYFLANQPENVKIVSNGSEMQISDVRFDQSQQALVIETVGQPQGSPDYAKGLREGETAGSR